VKGNQPGLRSTIRDRINAQRPPRSSARSRGHGRTEQRLIEVVPATGITFPGATQVFRIIRYTGGLDGQRQRKEVVHDITNLTTGEADDARLAALVREHWAIENNVHWVRDMTYREDAHRARTGNAPAVLACIRNLVTTALRLAGNLNLAVARRAATSNPEPSCDYSESSGNRTNPRCDGALPRSRFNELLNHRQSRQLVRLRSGSPILTRPAQHFTVRAWRRSWLTEQVPLKLGPNQVVVTAILLT